MTQNILRCILLNANEKKNELELKDRGQSEIQSNPIRLMTK